MRQAAERNNRLRKAAERNNRLTEAAERNKKTERSSRTKLENREEQHNGHVAGYCTAEVAISAGSRDL